MLSSKKEPSKSKYREVSLSRRTRNKFKDLIRGGKVFENLKKNLGGYFQNDVSKHLIFNIKNFLKMSREYFYNAAMQKTHR